MLQLVLGCSGTGKTYHMLAQIKARAQQGKRSLLLVPEQFTSSAETMTYKALGDALGAMVEVYSFTSYAEAVLRRHGGVAIETLTDAGRVVLTRRAMDGLGSALQSYARHRRSTGFCIMCADAIKELKIAGARGETLLSAASAMGEDGAKLRELGLIFAAYEGLLAGNAMDPSDRIATAAQRMMPQDLQEVAVFVDNFDGFTAPEYDMLAGLVQGECCTVALCCDGISDNEDGMGLFSPVKRTALRLRRAAASQGVGVAAPLRLEQDRRHAPASGTANVASLLATGQSESNSTQGVWLTPAQDIYDECKTVAAQIATLRQAGVPLKDMAIICRSLDSYKAPLQYELGLADIAFFLDAPTTLEHTAPAAFFRAALGLLSRGLSTEFILRLLKTDLCSIAPENIAAAENYAYTWQLRGSEWRAPFTKSPSGFGAQETPEDAALLEAAEAVRSQLMPKLEQFLAAAKGQDATGISRQLYWLLTALGGSQCTLATAQRLEAQGEALEAQGVYRTWNAAMALLDQMEGLLAGDTVTGGEYDELLLLLLRASDLGHVPQTQNQVIVTTADRMRLSSPRHCFVLGLSEGEFPKIAGFSGLLSHADRAFLVENGLEMPGSYENRTLLEQMFFYKALTAAAEGLYLSAVSPAKAGVPVSAALHLVVDTIAPPPLTQSLAQRAPTPSAALDLLGMQYREDTPETAALRAALGGAASHAGSRAALLAMESAVNPPPFRATQTQVLHALLGESLTLSPTRIEKYYSCRFEYFLAYILRIRPRKKAELSPLESGTLVHYILEHALRRSGAGFATLTPQELTALADAITQEYVAENLPGTGARFAYLIARLKAGALRLLAHLQKEQAQSSFHPIAFEQGIGYGEEEVEPLTLHTPEGTAVRITGKIDRVDAMEREGQRYLRVVDYKTGNKEFKLDEVYCGLNTQMLFYLFTLCKSAQGKCHNPVAAGVLYLAGDPAPSDKERAQAQQPLTYAVDGLVLHDEMVLRGMDKEATGVFVPVKFNKDGTPRTGAKLASLEKLGNIQKHLEFLAIEMARKLYAGDIAAVPLCSKTKRPCDVCDYAAVCRHEAGTGEAMIGAPRDAFEPTIQEEVSI